MTNETEQMSAERRVKAKWPDAFCVEEPFIRTFGFFRIRTPRGRYGMKLSSVRSTPEQAWQSAASRIESKEPQ